MKVKRNIIKINEELCNGSIIGVTHFVSDHCTIPKVLPDISALIRISLPQCGHFNISGFAGNIVVSLKFSKIGITLL